MQVRPDPTRFATVAWWYRVSIDYPKAPIQNRFLLLLLTATLFSSASLLGEQSKLVQVNIEGILLSADHQSATALAVLHNNSGVDVTNVDVDIALTSLRPTTISAGNPPTWRLDWSCQSTGAQSIRCRIPLLSGPPSSFWPLLITIDPAGEERYALTAQATWSVAGTTFTSPPWTSKALYEREVLITNTNDDGEGSFRAALTYANDTCARDLVPCALHFQFTEPKPEQGWYTIRPLTPFPAITAPDITIERISNLPGAPAVELDGSLLQSGNGLELRGEGQATINYPLSVGGFPWDGIVITRRGPVSISFCSLGIRPNRQPHGNGSRGVRIDTPATDVGISAQISANVRSGVFIMGGERITIDSSGIGRFIGEGPLLGNGASGVFVGPNARDVVIHETFIGGNAQMGVAIAPEARGVRIEDTWINPNGGLPIDHGLNGFSGETDDPSHLALPAPRIEVATFDPATKLTTIQGTFDAPDPDASWELTVYGSSIGLWPEFDLPTAVFRGRTFSVALPFLSGPIRATVGSARISDWSTSEYSQPIEVRTGSGTKIRAPF